MTIRLDAHKPEFHRAAPPQLPVRVATTANLTISTALNSGDTIDGVTLAAGDRVLVKDQSTGAQNGIYIASASPARAFDFEEGVAAYGALIYVVAGTANGGKTFRNTNTTVPTIGVTALTFADYTPGSGGSIDVTDGTTTVSPASEIEFDGTDFTVTDQGGGSALVELAGGGGGGGLTQAYVGYDTVGGSWETMTAARALAKKITLAEARLLTSIEAYIQQTTEDSVTGGFIAAVFEDNSGTPDEVIFRSVPVGDSLLMDNASGGSGASRPRWFRLPVGIWLTATDWWISVMAIDVHGTQIAKDGSGSDRYYTSGGAWYADWGWYSPTTTTDRYSIRGNTIR